MKIEIDIALIEILERFSTEDLVEEFKDLDSELGFQLYYENDKYRKADKSTAEDPIFIQLTFGFGEKVLRETSLRELLLNHYDDASYGDTEQLKLISQGLKDLVAEIDEYLAIPFEPGKYDDE